ncbi:MAG TPA: hypothetical protein VMS76_19080 [Planctomycetota bacterium]|nr:hypothetical protein [Planctomycetota bacterium]
MSRHETTRKDNLTASDESVPRRSADGQKGRAAGADAKSAEAPGAAPPAAEQSATAALAPPKPRTSAYWITEETAADFVSKVLYNPRRGVPVVGLTTKLRSRQVLLDADELVARLGARARVVVIPSGLATQLLEKNLPKALGAYGGAARIWWPGLAPDSNPYKHPLFLLRNPEEVVAVRARILAAVLGEWPAARAAAANGAGLPAVGGEPERRVAELSRELQEIAKEVDRLAQENRDLDGLRRMHLQQMGELKRALRASKEPREPRKPRGTVP